MKYLIFIILSVFQLKVHAYPITSTNGEHWEKVCSNTHPDFDEKSATGSCTMMLLGFQYGSKAQAEKDKATRGYCFEKNIYHLPLIFVDFIRSNPMLKTRPIYEVLKQFGETRRCDL
ncbi:hypothetical protein [Pseudoalteromonas viridis]|uniref:Rap1a immunity protein domain-containing protein n=1 Tax=Pseudoalteromonas viridis TaxID=339617 RepID=A0ABX7UZR9_9GAMM|nr:hypothetical protein [Pseudoalteromonas viridis]QTL34014.1 hypothetical protein J5X90_10530 [Pseudoalteromonas viridis]